MTENEFKSNQTVDLNIPHDPIERTESINNDNGLITDLNITHQRINELEARILELETEMQEKVSHLYTRIFGGV